MSYKFNPLSGEFDLIGVSAINALVGRVDIEGVNIGLDPAGQPIYNQATIAGQSVQLEFKSIASPDGTVDITADTTDVQLSVDAVFPSTTSTDNAITRFDGATGRLIQDSQVIISDAGSVSAYGGYTANNTPGTYTSALPNALSLTGAFTVNVASGAPAAAVADTTTTSLTQNQSPFFGGALFGALNTIKNTTSTAMSLGPYYALLAGTTFTAASAAVTQSASFPIFVNNSFSTTGGGTLATTQFSGIKIAGAVGSGVTITEWRGVEVNAPTNAGTVTTMYGVKIDPITTGSANYGLAVGAATTNTLWLSNTTVPTTEAGGIVFGSGKDVNLYRSAANTLKTDDSLVVMGRLEASQGADVASANNLVLGSDGNVFEITGTTQINLISNLTWQNGCVVTLLFTSTPTVKHAQATATTNITILLAGAVDFVATAGDTLTLVLSEIGGTQAWREVSRAVI